MIQRGIIVWDKEGQNWSEVNFDNPETAYDTHRDFANDYIAQDKERMLSYKEYKREIERNQNNPEFSQVLDPVDFLLQYYGCVKIGNKIDENTRFLLYYNQYDNFNTTDMGKKRNEIITSYNARGYKQERSGRMYVPDFVYDMQMEDKLCEKLSVKDRESDRDMER